MRVKKVCDRCRNRKDAHAEFSNAATKVCTSCTVASAQLNRAFDDMLNDSNETELKEIDAYLELHYGSDS